MYITHNTLFAFNKDVPNICRTVIRNIIAVQMCNGPKNNILMYKFMHYNEN